MNKKHFGYFSIFILILLITSLYGCNSKNGETSSTESTAQVQEKENSLKENISEEATNPKPASPAEEAENTDTEIDEAETDAPSRASNSLQPVYMSVWGMVGGTSFLFDMDGIFGSYVPYDMSKGKEYGQRRQLRLISYDPRTGNCVIDAYLNDKYIGQFKGIFEEVEAEADDGGSHFGQMYNGIFTSVKGAKLDFNFHFD